MKTSNVFSRFFLCLCIVSMFTTSCIKPEDDLKPDLPELGEVIVELVSLNGCIDGSSAYRIMIPYNGAHSVTKLITKWTANDGDEGSDIEDATMRNNQIISEFCLYFDRANSLDAKVQILGRDSKGEEVIIGSVKYQIIRPVGAK